MEHGLVALQGKAEATGTQTTDPETGTTTFKFDSFKFVGEAVKAVLAKQPTPALKPKPKIKILKDRLAEENAALKEEKKELQARIDELEPGRRASMTS